MNACTEVINVEYQVRNIVGSVLSIDASRVPLHSCLSKDLGMDSLAAMDILHDLEDTFSFTIDGLNPPPLNALHDLVTLAQLHAK